LPRWFAICRPIKFDCFAAIIEDWTVKPYRIFVRRDIGQEVVFSEPAEHLHAARDAVIALSKLDCGFDDESSPYIDDEDELLVVDVDGALVMAFKNEAFVNIAEIEPFELPLPFFIGMDVVGPNGSSILGTEHDPWGLEPKGLIRNEAAEIAKEWLKDNPGFHLVSRFQGDVQEETVYHLMPRQPALGM
jgi:hypothetical protein